MDEIDREIAVNAYHEAGHAQAHLHFGISLDEVCIDHTLPNVTDILGLKPVKQVAVLLAGGMAEAKYRWTQGDFGGAVGDKEDQKQIKDILHPLKPTKAKRVRLRANKKAQALVEKDWADISAIVKALCKEYKPINDSDWNNDIPGCLSYDQIVKIVADVKGA